MTTRETYLSAWFTPSQLVAGSFLVKYVVTDGSINVATERENTPTNTAIFCTPKYMPTSVSPQKKPTTAVSRHRSRIMIIATTNTGASDLMYWGKGSLSGRLTRTLTMSIATRIIAAMMPPT